MRAINKMIDVKQFGTAIDKGNELLHVIRKDISVCSDSAVREMYFILRKYLLLNKKHYQMWFDSVFQENLLQSASADARNVFFIHQLNHVKSNIRQHDYLHAICLCSALEDSLQRFLQISRVEYCPHLESIIIKCKMLYELAYYDWLNNEGTSFLHYHYSDNLKQEFISNKSKETNKALIAGHYQLAIDQYTDFIESLDGLSASAFHANDSLTLAWHTYIAMQRQRSIFEWLIQEYSQFQQRPKYISLLLDDLTLLVDKNHFFNKIKYEAGSKQHIITLLSEEAISRHELALMRTELCLAYDYFYPQQEYELMALILLGLGLLNAYEGNKHEMLQGFDLARDYNVYLKPLTQTFMHQFAFYMEPVPYAYDLLANPLKRLKLTKSNKPFVIKPPSL